MCRFLSVSRSTYYSWLKRRGMEDKDGPLIEAIRTGQNINKNTYGYRRMTLWLNNFIGIHVNNKRVRRVMKKAGLQAEIRKKWILRSKEPTIPQVMKFCSVANEPTVTTASPFIEMRYFISAVLA